MAKYDGLAGIYFFLSPQQASGNGEIKLHLRSGPHAADDLAVSLNSLTFDAVKAPGFYGFYIPAQASSNQKYYYALLEVTGSGGILVGKAAGVTYLNGALYQNGSPADAQAAFQLSYSRRKAILGLGREAISWAGILAVAFFLFILPGWGLFSLLWPGWGRFTWPEKLGLSAGLSLALYPLLLLWTDIVGLHLGALYAWLPPLTGLGIILWRNRKRLNISALRRSHALIFKCANLLPLSDVVLLIVLGSIIFTRFWAIRSLDLPMWADSYHHTMIAQLLIDHGGLFTSWRPYAELTTFTYHFGFHSDVAVFDWITHMDMPKAEEWVGQLMNILAIIVLYPLATKIGRSRWAGVVALLVAGLISPMPMFYVNWGRFTQLAGQVILPVVAWALWNIVTSGPFPDFKRAPKGMLAVGCVALGGLALTHYRVLILALIFLVTLWILYARRDTLRQMFLQTFWVGIGAGLLFLPWFIRVFGGRILLIFAHQMTTSAARAIEANPQIDTTGNLSFYLPIFLWVALTVVIGSGIWRREKGYLLISVWWFANILAANPYWLGLPGGKYIDSFTVFIAAYIPAGILLGAAVGWLGDRKIDVPGPQSKMRIIFSMGAAIFLIGVGLWGARLRLDDVQPSNHVQAARPDVMAAEWIRVNTPADARLLVNSAPFYHNTIIIATDGGWWLPLLARRSITVPPMNYGFEKDPWPGYTDQVNALTFEIQTKGIQDSAVLSQLQDRGISYVYIGQLQGTVNSSGPLFTPDQLLADPNYQLAYHQDRVWIFHIQPSP